MRHTFIFFHIFKADVLSNFCYTFAGIFGDFSQKSIQTTLSEVNANGCSVKAYVL